MGSSPLLVVGRDGWEGTLVAAPESGAEHAIVRLDDGQSLHVPLSALRRESETTYRLDLSRAELSRYRAHEGDSTVIPIIEERASVSTREVESGRVRIHKQVTEREETVDLPLMREEVTVERVPANRYVEGDTIPQPWEEGDTLVIPLVEEVLVVEKRLIVREELHVTKRRHEAREPQTVTLRREEATIERVAPDRAAEEENRRG